MQRFICALLVLVSTAAFAAESIESSDMRLVAERARALTTQYGKNQVLLVYDIDNTLLTSNQDLGGDAWFTWQAGKIAAGDHADTVAADIAGLLEAQAMIYSVAKMHAADPQTPQMFNQLQREGFFTLLLTSRGPSNRDATLRELARNGYITTIKPLGGRGVAGSYLPYDIQRIDQSGISRAEAAAMNLGPALPVSLQEGVYMTSGQHKGAMLRTALHKMRRSFKAIVFVDDTAKHVTRMHAAFDPLGVDVVTVRYSKMDPEVRRFESQDKSSVIGAWNRLKSVLDLTFPN